jgi:hypothetical protein
LSVEVKISEINTHRGELFKQIESLQSDCLVNLSQNLKAYFKDNRALLQSVNEWRGKLKKSDCSEVEIDSLRKTALGSGQQLSQKIESFQDKIMNNKIVVFEPNKSKSISSLIGALSVNDLRENSKLYAKSLPVSSKSNLEMKCFKPLNLTLNKQALKYYKTSLYDACKTVPLDYIQMNSDVDDQ